VSTKTNAVTMDGLDRIEYWLRDQLCEGGISVEDYNRAIWAVHKKMREMAEAARAATEVLH